jgi:ADP-ribosyl-[dinitrogen reductase] hydrolase
MSIDTNRARGTLLGLACGDALGRPVEFRSPARIEADHGRVTEMLGHGTHGQPAGTITDDTEMALRIARSLVERGGFDPDDVAERFVEWYESGPFDIGIMTSKSLGRIQQGEPWDEAGQSVWEASPEGSNAGNGSLMRCAPYALAFEHNREVLQKVSRDSSRITHADPRCQYGCGALNLVLSYLATDHSDPVERTLADLDDDAPAEVVGVLDRIPGSIDASDLSNSGYVIHTLEAGLYHGLTAETAEDAIVGAVMMGGDTDTIAAVAGAVAGARFGAEALPDRWIETLGVADELEELATTLESMITPPKPVAFPPGQAQPECAICGNAFEAHDPGFASRYANLVCEHCDERAVTTDEKRPEHGAEYVGKEPVSEKEDGTTVIEMAPDVGDNPVYVDGIKCWRRYRFGGWITRRDDHDCDSLEEFQYTHRGLSP